MANELKVTILDHDKETTTSNFRNSTVVSNANYDAQIALADALISAIDGVSIGTMNKDSFLARVQTPSAVPPANAFAQRETKWLVSMVDTNGDASAVEIGCADLALLPANKDELDITAGAGLALKNAIEAYHESKAGLAVTVVTVKHVGRNI